LFWRDSWENRFALFLELLQPFRAPIAHCPALVRGFFV
jgi:hypothetical protein